MEGVTQVYTWTAQMKGVGKAKGVDCNLNVTGMSMTPPKGIAWSKDQGMLMTMTGDMGIVKGVSLMKMTMGKEPNKRRLMDVHDNVRKTWLAQRHNCSCHF